MWAKLEDTAGRFGTKRFCDSSFLLTFGRYKSRSRRAIESNVIMDTAIYVCVGRWHIKRLQQSSGKFVTKWPLRSLGVCGEVEGDKMDRNKICPGSSTIGGAAAVTDGPLGSTPLQQETMGNGIT